MGVECVRLNFGNTTTLEQLLGCIIPRVINGQRVFGWQDGALVQALRASKWILFDEINLATAEVLDALVPLLFRDAKEYIVPRLGISIPLAGIRIFATMNPTSVGGGRSMLPRSLKNLFAVVRLEEYDPRELKFILSEHMKDFVQSGVMSETHVGSLFDLQANLRGKLARQEIGKIGGPFEFNLRSFSKFRDVLAGNSADQQFHYKYYQDEGTDDLEDIRTIYLNKFAQLVYSSAFQSLEDRREVASFGRSSLQNSGEVCRTQHVLHHRHIGF
jgi:midasin (ATPase involved in ribosome maturation)